MAAFSSVVALEQLLNQLCNSDQLPKEEVVPLLENISSLKSSLEKIFPAPKNERKEANVLADEIRQKIFDAQDKIESFIFTQSNPSESNSQSSSSISLQEIRASTVLIVDKAKELGDTIAKGINYTQSVAALDQLRNLLISVKLPKEDLAPLRDIITSLISSLEKIFPPPKDERKEANDLAVKITKIILEAHEKIQSSISTQTQNSLQEIAANIHPIVDKAKELGDKIDKARKSTQEPETFNSSLVGQKTKIVGQEKYKALIEQKLVAETGSRLVIPISGMPGIGKTTLAKSIYEDDTLRNFFPYKAWVTVSQDADVRDILGKILHSLESRGFKAGGRKYEGDEAMLRVELYQALSNKKYLVVMDDMWDTENWMKLQTALPDNENSSRILLTTRDLKVADKVKSTEGLVMSPLSDLDAWKLLRNKTFGDDQPCPDELENFGRSISSNCKGLPLPLTVLGGLLSKRRKDIEYWQSIEKETKADTFDVESYAAGILSLSYDNLPCKLKPCFLYMAAFPPDTDIPVSKLIMLWVAEGFVTPCSKSQLVEEAAGQLLLGLIDRNLVEIRKNRSNGLIKACGMHKSLRDLAEKESAKDMFFHLRKKHPQKLEPGTHTQRRVSVHNNVLMCLDDVYNSTKTIKKARSLLLVGAHHNHRMGFDLTFDLLRVLDAFSVFFIQFPDEIIKLIHLRYLSLTYNGRLPSRISRLHRLEFLIVKRQPIFIYVGTPFLPEEIWNMKELRHLILTETDLPLLSPTQPGPILLDNLQTLSNVNATCCTPEVLDRMPNLKKLVMWVEAPGKVGLHLNKLHQLEVFKFTVLDPLRGKGIEFQPRLFFPHTLRKLTLSGCGLPWEDMEAIAALPNLQVLKLKELAFHGHEWCPAYCFRELKFLLIEYLNLQKWEAEADQFPRLEQLIFRHCYDLEEFLSDIEDVDCLQLIEMVHCSPNAVAWAEDIEKKVDCLGNKTPRVHIYSSWE